MFFSDQTCGRLMFRYIRMCDCICTRACCDNIDTKGYHWSSIRELKMTHRRSATLQFSLHDHLAPIHEMTVACTAAIMLAFFCDAAILLLAVGITGSGAACVCTGRTRSEEHKRAQDQDEEAEEGRHSDWLGVRNIVNNE